MPQSVVMDRKSPGLSGIKVVDVPEQDKLEPNQVRIKNSFAGLNISDIDAAEGNHSALNQNGVLGFEAVGEIIECGKSVKRFKEGETVACGTSPHGGALAESMVIEEDHAIKMPDKVPLKTVAASIHKGMIAHFLITRAYIIRENIPILISDVARNPQARYIARWARSLGAIVIGTIADKSEVDAAESAGCHACFSYKDKDWSSKLLKKTGGYGVACIYDNIGKDAFDQSIKSLSKIGIMIMYGASSGFVDSVPLHLIKEKSLFLTAPTLFDYKNNANENAISASQLFHAIEVGALEPKVEKEISIQEVPKELNAIKNNKYKGSVLVRFDEVT